MGEIELIVKEARIKILQHRGRYYCIVGKKKSRPLSCRVFPVTFQNIGELLMAVTRGKKPPRDHQDFTFEEANALYPPVVS